MALPAPRVPALAHGSLLLPHLAALGSVVAHLSRPLSQSQGAGGQAGAAFGRRDGHTIRQDHGKRGTRGFDAHKRVQGRKRAIPVDTMGLPLCCRVEPANVQDRTLAHALLGGLKPIWPKVRCVFADAGFESAALATWLNEHSGWRLEIVKRSDSQAGFAVQPKRWVVERTFAWLGRNRRLSKDYEQMVQSSEAWILVATIRLVLRRLGKQA